MLYLLEVLQDLGRQLKQKMMKLFHGLPLDTEGNPLTFSQLCDYPNYQYFKGTKIAGKENFMKEHFGQYPVIHIDFATRGFFGSTETKNQMLDKFKRIMSIVYQDHRYLCNSDKLDEQWKTNCQKWCNEDFKRLKKKDIEDSLANLVNYLCTHHEFKIYNPNLVWTSIRFSTGKQITVKKFENPSYLHYCLIWTSYSRIRFS